MTTSLTEAFTTSLLRPCVLLALAVVMSLSCSRKVQNSEIIGSYTAQFPGGVDTLTLAAGGRFHQEIKASGLSQRHHTEGTWEFDPDDQHVFFDGNLLEPLDENGRVKENIVPRTNTIYSFGVQRSLGSVTLWVSDRYVYQRRRIN